MSKFRRLRQHTRTTRTVIPTPASLNPYQETGAEKAASSVHGYNKIIVASENGGARKQ